MGNDRVLPGALSSPMRAPVVFQSHNVQVNGTALVQLCFSVELSLCLLVLGNFSLSKLYRVSPLTLLFTGSFAIESAVLQLEQHLIKRRHPEKPGKFCHKSQDSHKSLGKYLRYKQKQTTLLADYLRNTGCSTAG